MTQPLIVLISGAPGSGKTTLGRCLADELQVPHINKDRIREGLWLTDPSLALDGERTWELWIASLRLLLTSGVSVVTDQTLYRGRSEAELRSRLLSLGRAVNVHARSPVANARWREKIAADPHWSDEQVAHLFAQVEGNAPLWTDPLDLGCPLIEVDTTNGYVPSIPELVAWVHTQRSDGRC
jgi:predicted kinase